MQSDPSLSTKVLPLQQAKLLRYIAEFHAQEAIPPSQSQMAKHLGVSNARNYLDPLLEKGYVERLKGGPNGRTRGFVLSNKGIEWVEATKGQLVLTLRTKFIRFRPSRGPVQYRLKLRPVPRSGTEAEQPRLPLRRGAA